MARTFVGIFILWGIGAALLAGAVGIGRALSADVLMLDDADGGHADIVLLDAARGLFIARTRSGNNREAALSTDSQHIVFVSSRDGQPDIYVMAAFSGDARRLTFNSAPANAGMPRWSPDRRTIAYTYWQEGGANVMIVAADGSSDARRLSSDHPIGSLEWAADGASLLFVTLAAWDNAIYRVEVDALRGSEYPIAPGSGRDYAALESPDGTRVTFASERARAGTAPLYLLDRATDQLRRLTTGERNYVDYRWSPDGTHLAAFEWAARTQASLALPELVLIDPQTGAVVPLLTAHIDTRAAPVWSPDGRRIAVSGVCGGVRCLYLVGVDGKIERGVALPRPMLPMGWIAP
ncbi:MAG: hypothetical protein SGI73_03350 [Chloroflexota bacterium]|nr:hypothetical protein [Chloroflexota bacterium]